MLKFFTKVLKDNRGFSLIELIVVVAILGVIAGIAAPNVIGYVNNARDRADESNGAAIANAMLRAVAEGETLPDTDDDDEHEDVDDANLFGTGDGLAPTYINSIPTPEGTGFTKFVYLYDTTDGLRIFRSNANESTVDEVYPN